MSCYRLLPAVAVLFLQACGAQQSALDLDSTSTTLNQAEMFDPQGPASGWMVLVQHEMQEAERTSARSHQDQWLDQVTGARIGATDTGAQFNGGMTGPNTFVGILTGTMRTPMIFSPTPPEEKVEEYRITRAVDWITSTGDCHREISKNCDAICRESRYDCNGRKVVVLMGGPPGGKRRDRCRIEGGFRKYSEKGREGNCYVFQANPPNCTAAANAAQHPIGGCQYFRVVVQTRWSYALNCTLNGGTWSCEKQAGPGLDCSIAELENGAPYAPPFCESLRAAFEHGDASYPRATALMTALDRHFQP